MHYKLALLLMHPGWINATSAQGTDWDEQIVEALRTCNSLLFVMTREQC